MLQIRRKALVLLCALLPVVCAADGGVDWLLEDALQEESMPLFRPSVTMPEEVRQAFACYEAHDYRRSAGIFARLRKLSLPDGTLDFVCFILAESYRMLGLADAAHDEYEYIIQRFPNSDKAPAAWFRLQQYACAAHTAAMVDSVHNIFRARYLNHPLYNAVIYQTGKEYFRNRQYAEAAELLARIPKTSAFHLRAQFLSALSHVQLKNWEKALLLLDYVRKNAVDEKLLAEADIVSGDIYYSRDTLQTAFKYYAAVPKTAGRYQYALVKMAWLCMAQKDYARARDLVLDYIGRRGMGEYFFEIMSLLKQAYLKLDQKDKSADISDMVYRHVVLSRARFDLLNELGKAADAMAGWRRLEFEAAKRSNAGLAAACRENISRCANLEKRMYAFLRQVSPGLPSDPDTVENELAARRYLKVLKSSESATEDSLQTAQSMLDTIQKTAQLRNTSGDTLVQRAVASATAQRDSLKFRQARLEEEQATVKRECLGGIATEDETAVKYIDWAFITYQNKKAELAEMNRRAKSKEARGAKPSDTTAGAGTQAASIYGAMDREKLKAEIAADRAKLYNTITSMLDYYPRSKYNPQIMMRLAELDFDNAADDFDKRLRDYERRMAEGGDSGGLQFPEYTLDNAIKIYDRIGNEYPKDALADQACFYKALSLQKVGQYDSANTVLLELAKKYPESSYFVEANMIIGRYYFEHPTIQGGKGYKLAENAFREVLYYRDHPQFVQALYNLGWCYYMQDQYEEAISVFKYLVEEVELNFDPTRMDEQQVVNPLLRGEAIDYIAISFDEENRIDEAVNFLKLIGNADYAALVLKRIGELREEVQDFAVAQTVYERLLKEYPMSTVAPEAMASLIRIYDSQNLRDRALDQREAYFVQYVKGSAWQRNVAERDSTLLPLVDSMAISNGLYVADAAYRAAEADKRPEEYDRAVKNFGAVVAAYPGNPRAMAARWNLALILDQKMGQTDSAYVYYINFSRDTAADPEKREQSALNAIAIAQRTMPPDTAIEEGKIEPGAVRMLDAAENYLKQFPNGKSQAEVLFSVAAIYFNRKMFANAEKTYARIITKYPKTDNAYKALFLSGQCFFGEENWPQASASFEAVWRESASEQQRGEARRLLLQSQYMHAKQMFAAGDFKNAASAFIAIEDRFSQSEYGDVVLFNAAESFEKLDSITSACQAYYRLFKNYSGSKLAPGGLFNAASDYEKINDFEKAAATYEDLVLWYSTSDKAKDALFNLGFCYEKLNKPDKMAEANERYTMLYPGEKDAKAMLLRSAQFYFKAKMNDKAKTVFASFMRRFPDDPMTVEALFKIGKVTMDEGDRQQAAQYFAQAEKQNEQFALAKKETNNYYAAEAAYYIGVIQQDAFRALKFIEGLKTLKAEQQTKTDLMAQAAKAYTRVIQYQSERMFEAAYRVGQMYEEFAADWENQKREETDPIKAAVFEKDLSQISSVLFQKSLIPYKKALEIARGFDSLGAEQKQWIDSAKVGLARSYYEAGDLLVKALDAMYNAPVPKEIRKKPLHFFQYQKQLCETMEPQKTQIRDYYLLAHKDLRAMAADSGYAARCRDRFSWMNYRIGGDWDVLTQKIVKKDYEKPDNMSADAEDELNFQLEDILYELQDKAIFGLEDAKSRADKEDIHDQWYRKVLEALARLSPETYGKNFYASAILTSDSLWRARADTAAGWKDTARIKPDGWSDAVTMDENGITAAGSKAPIIWSPDKGSQMAVLRRDFSIGGIPRNASLYYSVNGKFKLYINGQLIANDTVGLHTLERIDSMTNVGSLVKGGDNAVVLYVDALANAGGMAFLLHALIDTTQRFASSLPAAAGITILAAGETPSQISGEATAQQPEKQAAAADTSAKKTPATATDTTAAPPAATPRADSTKAGTTTSAATIAQDTTHHPTASSQTAKPPRKEKPAYIAQYKSHGELLLAIEDYHRRAQSIEQEIRHETVELQKLGIQQQYFDTKIKGVQTQIDSVKKVMEEKTRAK